jgi:hypothetical protein
MLGRFDGASVVFFVMFAHEILSYLGMSNAIFNYSQYAGQFDLLESDNPLKPALRAYN